MLTWLWRERNNNLYIWASWITTKCSKFHGNPSNSCWQSWFLLPRCSTARRFKWHSALLEHPLKLDIFADLLREPRLPTLYFTFTLILILNKQCCLVLHFRGWMKDSPKQMGSLCTRSVEPASPPFGQQNCPEMDSCAQGRAYRKWNHTQYLWLPQGLATHWPGHTAADRHTVGSPKFCTRSATIHHTFRLRDEVVLQESFCVAKCPVSLVYVTYYFNI